MTQPEALQRVERNRKILEATPENRLARFALANALFESGAVQDAADEYRRCLQAQPDWMAVAISLGRCLVLTGRLEEARETLRAARALAVNQGHSSPLAEIDELVSRCGGA
ncbi:MAG TPA: tetratricopeptide repeat protein [Candidatus Polarisedimenticolia bacterium]|nr:tetratricopeptide repeat protein [Candidatus Polarisedimenticolia bacterium]